MEPKSQQQEFFNEKDFSVLALYAEVRKNAENAEHTEVNDFLKTTYDKVYYWAKEIKKEYSDFEIKISRKPTNQAGNFAEYLWAKIYPSSFRDLAYTVDINAYDELVIKIDTISTRNIGTEKRQTYETYRDKKKESPIVLVIPKEEVLGNDWNYLVNKSIAFINNTIEDYRALVELFKALDVTAAAVNNEEKSAPSPSTILPNNTSPSQVNDFNVWLLIYSFRDWPKVFDPAQTYWLENKMRDGRPRNVPENYHKAKKGDLIVTIHRENDVENRSFFEITKELHQSETKGEIIEFKLIHQTIKSIVFLDLVKNVIAFAMEATQYNFTNGLYKLVDAEIEELLNLFSTSIPEIKSKKNESTVLPVIKSDSGFDDIDDQLDFNADIESLAALTAYKKIAPPLAIGLFGNWGKGKSYFMHHLAKKIGTYQSSSNDAFCTRIVKVHFNSWHYSDTNLWASLANQIFGTLKKYLDTKDGTEQDQGESAKLFRELNSAQAKIKEKEDEKNLLETQIGIVNKRLEAIKLEKQGKVDALNISPSKIIQTIIANPDIKKDIERLNSLTVGPHIESIETLSKQLSLLQNVTYRTTQAFRNISKYNVKQWVFFIVLPIVIVSAPWVLATFFKNQLGNFHILFTSFSSKLITLATGAVIFLRPINKVLAFHESLHASMMRLKQEELEKKEKNEIEIEKILEQYKTEETIISKQIETLTITKNRLESEIKDIGSGKRLAEWISDRALSEDYKKHLGIISLIREDFERLNELMDDQKKAVLNYGDGKDLIKIDRIVLFIDDLDRCPVNKVMEVLQAVNMLLSFKLFVVIVGVDPRWLENAIENKYKLEMGEGNDPAQKLKAQDYLEKIFQIPFQLKRLSAESSKNLIHSLINTTNGINNNSQEVEEMEEEETEEESKSSGTRNQVKGTPISLGGTTVTQIVKVKEKVKETVQKKIESQELELSQDEKDFMLALAPLLTNSPRSIKRFVNIYRLIKAHPDYRKMLPKRIHNEMTLSLLCVEISGQGKFLAWFRNLSQTEHQKLKFSEVPNYPLSGKKGIPLAVIKLFEENTVSNYEPIIEFVKRFSYH